MSTDKTFEFFEGEDLLVAATVKKIRKDRGVVIEVSGPWETTPIVVDTKQLLPMRMKDVWDLQRKADIFNSTSFRRGDIVEVNNGGKLWHHRYFLGQMQGARNGYICTPQKVNCIDPVLPSGCTVSLWENIRKPKERVTVNGVEYYKDEYDAAIAGLTPLEEPLLQDNRSHNGKLILTKPDGQILEFMGTITYEKDATQVVK